MNASEWEMAFVEAGKEKKHLLFMDLPNEQGHAVTMLLRRMLSSDEQSKDIGGGKLKQAVAVLADAIGVDEVLKIDGLVSISKTTITVALTGDEARAAVLFLERLTPADYRAKCAAGDRKTMAGDMRAGSRVVAAALVQEYGR